jgi:preprotein translocase subunit YajC
MNLTNPILQQVVPWVPVLVITLLFYVLVMGPVRKRQKAVQQMIENLKKGDRVVTNGGLYGEVAAVTGATVILKIADNVKVKIAKSAITGLDAEGEKGGAS